MRFFHRFIFLLSIAVPFSQSQAADNMKFSGTLIEPPICKVNNNGDKIDVDFKQVGVSKVDGVNYLITVNYQVECGFHGNANWGMKLEIIGTAIDYDQAAIKTDVTYLGIRMLLNDKPFTLNEPISIIEGNKIILKAVPVKKPGYKLEPKPFSATATLLAVYQ